MTRTAWMTGFALLLATATTLQAQNAADLGVSAPQAAAATAIPSSDTSTTPSAVAPATITTNGPIAVQRIESATVMTPFAVPRQAGHGKNVAMMVVGVAGLVTGAVIGGTPGTIIMIGGGVVGLMGLYHYMQ
jgi:hypothetical protein